MEKIKFEDKFEYINNPTIPEVNKITAVNVNEIKTVVNANADALATKELTKVNLDTYNYVVNTTYQSDTLCTNGPLAIVVPYYIECLPITNGYVVRFTDQEGHQFTRKKINGTWDSGYSSPIY